VVKVKCGFSLAFIFKFNTTILLLAEGFLKVVIHIPVWL
jgi:hypothetical protein